MRNQRAMLTAFVAASCTIQPSASAQDLCRAREVVTVSKAVVPVFKGAQCSSDAILYRSDGTVTRTFVAAVFTGYRSADDMGIPTYQYFLRTPLGRIVDLGDFPPGRFFNDSIYGRLNYGLAWGGGLVRTDFSLFGDRIIERHLDRYCVVYKMKGIYSGELRDCTGTTLEGEAGYAPGVITQSDAATQLSNRISTERSLPYTFNSIAILQNALRRDAKGTYYYRLVARIHQRPDELFEDRVFRLDARTGGISLLNEPAQ